MTWIEYVDSVGANPTAVSMVLVMAAGMRPAVAAFTVASRPRWSHRRAMAAS